MLEPMKPVSILIPAANHPELLHTALRSVSRQTAIEEVEEIIVSENAGNRDTEKVCSEFPHLPIRYIFQATPLPILEHFLFVYRQARADIIAFLCDDDWWAPGHLQTALCDLKKRPELAAWFSACMYLGSDGARAGFLGSEGAQHGWISRTAVLWLAAGKPDVTMPWYLKPQDVLAANGIHASFHLSTMVARRELLLRAAHGLDSCHPRQFDQYLYVGLSREGAILYDPLIDTFIRWHEHNYSVGISLQDRERESRRCTEDIWQRASRDGIDLTAIWRHHLARAPKEVLADVGQYFRMAMSQERLVERGFGQFIPPAWPIRLWRNATRFSRRVIRYLKEEVFSLQ